MHVRDVVARQEYLRYRLLELAKQRVVEGDESSLTDSGEGLLLGEQLWLGPQTHPPQTHPYRSRRHQDDPMTGLT